MAHTLATVPYASNGTLWAVDDGVLQRLKHYRGFLNLYGLSVLDVGQASYISSMLGISNHTCETDFNWDVRSYGDPYDVVTCFEVLEHVMNPALFLSSLICLMKPHGALYLSTPLAPPLSSLVWRGHFTEYRMDALNTLFDYVGLKVRRVEVFRSLPFSHALTGIRPFIRWAWAFKTVLFELTVGGTQ
jgi:hypothetical protein